MTSQPVRTHLDPPPPTTDTDQLDRTARQVRLPDCVPHQLVAETFNSADGKVYLGRCGERLTAAQGAFLTTREAECRACKSGSRRTNELLEALP